MDNKRDLIIILQDLLKESIRLYEANNRGAYEAGRIDGLKWAIEEISKKAL
jgi:hypothetical protein